MRSISTTTGDSGETSLAGGVRVSKSSARVEAYGTIDELNSTMGLARSICDDPEMAAFTKSIQEDLFRIGSSLATPPESPKPQIVIEPSSVERLTAEVHRIEAIEGMLADWSIPGEHRAAAAYDVARTICRRAERNLVRLQESGAPIQPALLAYVNRLSDLLWLFGRKLEHEAGVSASLREATGKAGEPVFPRVVTVMSRRVWGTALRCMALVLGLWAMLAAVPAQTLPTRIVSTSPSITETLFALGLGNRVVGVSIYCRFPEDVKRLPKVGTFMKPDAELIAGLKPDLVFIHPGANGLDRRLASLRIPAATVGQGTRLQSVLASIRQIASAAGVAAQGESLAADVQRRLDGIRTASRGASRPRVLFIIGRRPGQLTDLVGIGPGSYLDDLIEIAGGINVLAIAGQPEYPRISMETVLRLAPDVIIDTVDMGDTDAERVTRRPVNERLWAAYPGLTAVRTGRVRAATTDTLVVPGPRIVEAAQWVVQQLTETPAR